MGGIGSGSWYRWNKQTTVDECKRVDIRYMRKHGLLKPYTMGSLSWTRGGEPNGFINYTCYEDKLALKFRYREYGDEWQPVNQNIYFTTTTCNYGGIRKWFACPNCGRRVAVLCSDGPLFLCRHCYQLPYSSQNEGKIDRVFSKKHKLGAKIFENYDNGYGWLKKKGMHWKTFERHYRKYQRVNQQVEDITINMLKGLDIAINAKK